MLFATLLACIESSTPLEAGGGNGEGGGGGGGGASGSELPWDGLIADNWIDPVEVRGDTMVLNGNATRYSSHPISMGSASQATFTFDLVFSGNTDPPHTLFTEVLIYGPTSFGYWSWTTMPDTDRMLDSPGTYSFTVYDNDWTFQEVSFDSIRVRVQSYNHNLETWLLNPRIF